MTKFGFFSCLAGFALCFLFTGCGDDAKDGEIQDKKKIEEAARKQRREDRAVQLLFKARIAMPAIKIQSLGDLAHQFWDTEAGATGWKELVIEHLQGEKPDYEGALREMESFRKHRDVHPETTHAATMIVHAITSRVEIDPRPLDEAKKTRLAAIKKTALTHWLELSKELVTLEDQRGSVAVHQSRGEALFYAGRLEEAERAWAKIEELKLPIEEGPRVAFLVQRADLLHNSLGKKAEAKAIYEEALAKLKDLDETTKETYVEYIQAQLNGDEAKSSGN